MKCILRALLSLTVLSASFCMGSAALAAEKSVLEQNWQRAVAMATEQKQELSHRRNHASKRNLKEKLRAFIPLFSDATKELQRGEKISLLGIVGTISSDEFFSQNSIAQLNTYYTAFIGNLSGSETQSGKILAIVEAGRDYAEANEQQEAAKKAEKEKAALESEKRRQLVAAEAEQRRVVHEAARLEKRKVEEERAVQSFDELRRLSTLYRKLSNCFLEKRQPAIQFIEDEVQKSQNPSVISWWNTYKENRLSQVLSGGLGMDYQTWNRDLIPKLNALEKIAHPCLQVSRELFESPYHAYLGTIGKGKDDGLVNGTHFYALVYAEAEAASKDAAEWWATFHIRLARGEIQFP